MTPNATLRGFFQKHGLTLASTIEETEAFFAEKNLQRNELHLKEGRVANEYMILESGFLRAYTHTHLGEEVTTAFYAPGAAVFEVASFFNRVPSKENIQALTNSKGWFITYEQLNHLFHAYPAFREFGRAVLVRGFAALKERMLSAITETAEQRYSHLLQTAPDIFQQAPLKYIASYLGITDTSLSRIRKELAKK